MKTNYYEQLIVLRATAIADITKYIVANGETTIRNLDFNPPLSIRIVKPYLVIGEASATVTSTRWLVLIADMLNQMQ